jgi:hypothetical protein
MKILSVLSRTDVRGLVSSASGTQLTTAVPGAATFAGSSTFASYTGSLVTPVATISGGFLNDGGSTNSGSGFPSNGNISNWVSAIGSAPADAVTITFNQPEAYFGLLWGSMDGTNTISFYNGSTLPPAARRISPRLC